MSKFQSLFSSPKAPDFHPVHTTQKDYIAASAEFHKASNQLAKKRANDVVDSTKGDIEKSAKRARNAKYVGAAAGAGVGGAVGVALAKKRGKSKLKYGVVGALGGAAVGGGLGNHFGRKAHDKRATNIIAEGLLNWDMSHQKAHQQVKSYKTAADKAYEKYDSTRKKYHDDLNKFTDSANKKH